MWNNHVVLFQSKFFFLNASSIQKHFEEKVERKVNKRKEGRQGEREGGRMRLAEWEGILVLHLSNTPHAFHLLTL